MKQKLSTPGAALRDAQRHGYALGAFNVSSDVTLKAVVQAAVKMRSPVIIEASGGESSYLGYEQLGAWVEACRNTERVPIFLNLDHAQKPADVMQGIRAGFHMLHFDGSLLPRAKNVAALKRLVPIAHQKGLVVEGEIDHISGSSDVHRARAESFQDTRCYTDPDEAEEFVRLTNVDIFASFIGNVHGVFASEERLDLKRLRAIRKRLSCALSLHGGSGIADRDVRSAIRGGISKVNVNTELRVAFHGALCKAIAKNAHEVVWYKLVPPVISAVQKVVERKMKLFGSAGRA